MADFAKFDAGPSAIQISEVPNSSSNLASSSSLPSHAQKPNSALNDAEAAALTEPVYTTIWKELKRICVKLRYVLLPIGTSKIHARHELRNWDLWGPLIFCLLLSILLSTISSSDQNGLIFQLTFIIVWCGAGVVAINGKLLGGKISFFQAVCTLGYCIFPIVISASIILFIRAITQALWVKLIIASLGFSWSTFASSGFLSEMMPPERKALGLYPIFLFYLFLSWFTLT